MSRALGPRASAGDGGSGAAWVVLIACWSAAGMSGLIWAAAVVASAVAGGRTEPFGMKFIRDVLHGRSQDAWPHTPTAAVVITAVFMVALAAGLAAGAFRLAGRWRAAPGDPVAALSRNPRIRALTGVAVARGGR